MPIIRKSDCVPLPIVVCPVVAVVMLKTRVARCVHWRSSCVPLPIIFSPVVAVAMHTSCHPTLQHHNSYWIDRTDNYRQWNAVGSPDDGHKDARNMLRYYWLPINHYLLHLVGLPFTYLCKRQIIIYLPISYNLCTSPAVPYKFSPLPFPPVFVL